MLNRMLTNGRVLRMARLLKKPLPTIVGHLAFLLKDAYEHIPKSGRLSPNDLRSIEFWAMWDGKQGAFLAQLVTSRLILKTKKGHYFAKFWQDAPVYVRKRWLRNDLRQNSIPQTGDQRATVGIPLVALQGAQNRSNKNRTDKIRKEKSPTDVVVPEKKERAPDLSAACSAQTAQLVRLLAEKPDVPPRILLAGAGMDGAVAINLCATNDAHRIRQVVV